MAEQGALRFQRQDTAVLMRQPINANQGVASGEDPRAVTIAQSTLFDGWSMR